MSDVTENLLDRVAAYYSDKVQLHGATARGVDWKDEGGQNTRFDQLLLVLGDQQRGTLAEIGCGYGALAAYMAKRGLHFDYTGCDISAEMLTAARDFCKDIENVTFEHGTSPSSAKDYVVASGIFNVRFDFHDRTWTQFIWDTIDAMAAAANKGIAFNFLTSFSDADRKRPDLWYADPGEVLNKCVERFGRQVTVAHDYGMYEFTVRIVFAEGRGP
jgi:SAM-dependent methyltransferase